MGFLDKAKKLAEQAQNKIDDAQDKFNAGQVQRQAQHSAEQVVKYDQFGRPIKEEPQQTETPTPNPEAVAEVAVEQSTEASKQVNEPSEQASAAESTDSPPITEGDPLAG